MQRSLLGRSASPGIVVGPVRLLRWEVPDVPHRVIGDDDIEAEVERLHAAIERAKERLRNVRARAEKHAGHEEAAIFEVQVHILEDEALLAEFESFIRQNLAAEKAVDLVLLEWRQRFARSTAPMIRERVGDLMDLHIRLLSVLMNLPDHDPVDVPKGTNAILVTHDLTPSLTVQLDREAIAGIATDSGTGTSHVAILARSLGMPAVVGLRDATALLHGDEIVVLDGSNGILVINPTPEEIADYRGRAAAEAKSEEELLKLADVEAITTDGVVITLRANVDLPEEAEHAARSGAHGVGLMRTEFLVVGRATASTGGWSRPSRDTPSSSEPSTWAATSFPSAGIRMKPIHFSVGARSECASTNPSCSGRSCARSSGRDYTVTSASCCHSSSRSTKWSPPRNS